MFRHIRVGAAAGLAALWVAFGWAPLGLGAGAPSYELVDIAAVLEQQVGPTTFSRSWDINNSCQVAGYVDYVDPVVGSRHLPFIYDHTAGSLVLGSGFGEFVAINDTGLAVGFRGSENVPIATVGLLDEGQLIGPVDLASGFLNPPSRATGLNNADWVTGWHTKPGVLQLPLPFALDDQVQFVAIPAAGGGGNQALGVNNANGIIGIETNLALSNTGFYFGPVSGQQGNVMVRLGTLGGLQSLPFGVNDAGYIVGESTTGESELLHRAFLTHADAGGVLQDLGTLGGPRSSAYDVNNRNVIVGTSEKPGSPLFFAFVLQDGQMVDLNERVTNGEGWHLTEARAINDEGFIVAQAIREPSVFARAVLLIPRTASQFGFLPAILQMILD